MADAASFVINLIDKISGPAKASEKSLAQLDTQIKKDSAALKTLDAAMARLSKAGGASTERMQGLEKAIASKKAAVADATNAIADMAGKHDHASASTARLTGSTEKLGGASEETAGSLGQVGGAAGAVAVAVGVAALAVGALIYKMAELSVKSHEAYEAQRALAFAETGSQKEATRLADAQQKIAQHSSLAEDKIFSLADSLFDAGVNSKQFGSSLQAMADIVSVAGDKAGKKIEKIIANAEQLNKFQPKDTAFAKSGLNISEVYDQLASDLGLSTAKIKAMMAAGKITAEQGVEAINEAIEKKMGAAARGKAGSLSVQIRNAKQDLTNLFKNVDAGPLEKALKPVLGLLDSSTKQGRSLQKTLTKMMNSVFKTAANVVPQIEGFFLDLAIAVLDVGTTCAPLIKVLKKALGIQDGKTEDGMKKAAAAGKQLGYALGFVATGAVLAVIGIAYVVRAVIAVAQAIGKAVSWISNAINSVVQAIGSAAAKAGSAALGIGKAIIDGIVNGITAGAGAVKSAITGVAKGAIDSAKGALGIHSPSKVFFDVGGQVTKGMQLGIDSGKSKVDASVRHLVSVPRENAVSSAWGRASPVAGNGSGAGAAGTQVHIAAGAFNVTVHGGAGKSDEIGAAIRRELEKFTEMLAAQMGATSGG